MSMLKNDYFIPQNCKGFASIINNTWQALVFYHRLTTSPHTHTHKHSENNKPAELPFALYKTHFYDCFSYLLLIRPSLVGTTQKEYNCDPVTIQHTETSCAYNNTDNMRMEQIIPRKIVNNFMNFSGSVINLMSLMQRIRSIRCHVRQSKLEPVEWLTIMDTSTTSTAHLIYTAN